MFLVVWEGGNVADLSGAGRCLGASVRGGITTGVGGDGCGCNSSVLGGGASHVRVCFCSTPVV